VYSTKSWPCSSLKKFFKILRDHCVPKHILPARQGWESRIAGSTGPEHSGPCKRPEFGLGARNPEFGSLMCWTETGFGSTRMGATDTVLTVQDTGKGSGCVWVQALR
jgi:hypothetical protein